MAVVVSKENMAEFLKYADEENLEATHVADVTDTGRVKMYYDDKIACDMSREFMDSTGAPRKQKVVVDSNESVKYFDEKNEHDLNKYLLEEIKGINHASKKNLLEHFDFSVGRATSMMPLGGKNQITPINSMVAKIPSKTDLTNTVSYMSFGFIPELSAEDPFFCLLYTSPSPRDRTRSRMPSSA